MNLITEELGVSQDIQPGELDRVLREDSFGKFAILSVSERVFLQAASAWNPGAECAAFVRETGSDPWVLEYGEAGAVFRADAPLTDAQVRAAFLAYLSGERSWHGAHTWVAVRDVGP